jgi:hypothetical protein
MHPGLRVKRPFGEVEIRTFTRSEKDQDTLFTVEYLIRNEGSKEISFPEWDSFRLIADGVPRAPDRMSPGGCCGLAIRADSAEYAAATFSVRGQPNVVILQLGTSTDGHTYMRWPE